MRLSPFDVAGIAIPFFVGGLSLALIGVDTGVIQTRSMTSQGPAAGGEIPTVRIERSPHERMTSLSSFTVRNPCGGLVRLVPENPIEIIPDRVDPRPTVGPRRAAPKRDDVDTVYHRNLREAGLTAQTEHVDRGR